MPAHPEYNFYDKAKPLSIYFISNLGDLILTARHGSIEQPAQLLQFAADFRQELAGNGRRVVGMKSQVLTGAVDGEPFLVKESFDLKDQLHIFAGVKALARGRPPGGDLRELRLPEPQNMSRHLRDRADFPDFEIELVGDGR